MAQCFGELPTEKCLLHSLLLSYKGTFGCVRQRYTNTSWSGTFSLYLTAISTRYFLDIFYYKITALKISVLCCWNEYMPMHLHKAYLGNWELFPRVSLFWPNFRLRGFLLFLGFFSPPNLWSSNKTLGKWLKEHCSNWKCMAFLPWFFLVCTYR